MEREKVAYKDEHIKDAYPRALQRKAYKGR